MSYSSASAPISNSSTSSILLTDIYVHRNRPCRSVEVVGIVVGSHLRSWDTSVEYLSRSSYPILLIPLNSSILTSLVFLSLLSVDDGTEVISVHPVKITAADALAIVKKERAAAAAASASRLKEQLSSHPLPPPTDPHSQGIPEEYRPRIPQSVKDKENAILLKEKMAMEQEQTEVQIGTIVEVGQLVRVVGKIGFHRWAPDENLIVDATIGELFLRVKSSWREGNTLERRRLEKLGGNSTRNTQFISFSFSWFFLLLRISRGSQRRSASHPKSC